RSRALSDIDLIALIGRHGLPHARAIARRKALNPTIADLIKALEKPTLVRLRPPQPIVQALPAKADPAPVGSEAPIVKDEPALPASADMRETPGIAAANARRRLRAMMRPEAGTESVNPFIAPSTFTKLRETALTGNAAFFQTALADALDIDFQTARALTEQAGYAALLAALRSLDLNEDRAFLIAVAVYPREFPHPQAIRLFLDRYRLLHRDAALDKVRAWKVETLSRAIRGNAGEVANAEERRASNSDDSAANLKAS
ncbi:MAG: hypothetical protein E5V62_05895, partial [Mesorhizobium sp.]